MILRGIHIEHWRCIANLDLTDLPSGIVVLYGPNRTGKSSVVKALRGCLFDFAHDTSQAELKASLPWNGKGPPKLAVEFETGGSLYRITKVFSKKTDGLARLDTWRKGAWEALESAPKEAARRVRELLGTDKSDAGMNQLLWVDQGDVTLPEARKLDNTLEQRLVSVLGMMVTGRDLAFKQALDEHCDTWFTPKGKQKSASRLSEYENAKDERQEKLEEHQKKLREVEQTILDMENCLERLPELEKGVLAAQAELQRLKEERDQTNQRRQAFHLAQQEFRAAEQAVRLAQERLTIFQEAKKRWQEAEAEATKSESGLQSSRAERDRLDQERQKKTQALEAARAAEEKHQGGQEVITDCRRLLSLSGQRTRLEAALKRALELAEEIRQLEHRIQEAKGPDSEGLAKLRANRETAARLRVQLQADELSVRVTLRQQVPFQFQLDGGTSENVSLSPEEPRSWAIRQEGVIDLPNLARIEISRNRQNLDLERAARQLESFARDFRAIVLAFDEQPEDEGCLNRLTNRLVERQSASTSLEAVRRELTQVAPRGPGTLETDRAKLDSDVRIIHGRRPELSGWQPCEQDVSDRERRHQERTTALQRTRKEQEAAEKQANQAYQNAENLLRERENISIGQRATAKSSRDALERSGDETVLQQALQLAEEALTAARERVGKSELTAAEQTIEQRYQDAETALQLREKRLHDLKDEMNRQRGRLEGSEGLHTRVADAESAVREAEEALAREQLEADAHKRLRDLFEDCRDNQVAEVMGPIGARVLQWSQSIGLNEYREVRFGERYLPDGIMLDSAGVNRLQALADESYGTGEQLSLLVRLALGGTLARDEPTVAILDDPLAHADAAKHRRILEVLRLAAEGSGAWTPAAGPLQILIFTCHPDRFDYLTSARQIDLASLIVRES